MMGGQVGDIVARRERGEPAKRIERELGVDRKTFKRCNARSGISVASVRVRSIWLYDNLHMLVAGVGAQREQDAEISGVRYFAGHCGHLRPHIVFASVAESAI
jgi:hypothetical protein